MQMLSEDDLNLRDMTPEELEKAWDLCHGDLEWYEPTPGCAWVKFTAGVESDEGWPLKVAGSYSRENRKISFSLLHSALRGRLYGLDIGSAHAFPDQTKIEETHKHRWNEQDGFAHVFVPDDITAGLGEPLKAWGEFCAEAKIKHDGELQPPPTLQEDLPW